MNMTPRNQLIQHSQHLTWLEAARTMADTPSAINEGLSLADAYGAIATIETRMSLNPLVGYHGPEEEAATNMNAGAFFATAEAIDTMLTHGTPAQAENAAIFTVELAGALPISVEADKKQGILASVLGIELSSDTPVAQQIVESRLLPTGAPEDQLALAGILRMYARTA